ncbi:uncharacterized protein LOC128951867 [Oppia nitens]|uniref:uncharacterized protein LOC128951867 n=1 Tax=Oppia nitens TaxID=1686743 RepID=UPI0023DA5B06|nr:uncharacterized protein LOC128951867 [Oppia nitens]
MMKDLTASGGIGCGSFWSTDPKTLNNQLVEWADRYEQSGHRRKSHYWPNQWLMPCTVKKQQISGNRSVVSAMSDDSDDRKSIIIGLANSGPNANKRVLAAVLQLVRSWNDPMINNNNIADDLIESVERNGKLFGRSLTNGTANVLVTARTVEANCLLLAGADKYLNTGTDSSGIKWKSKYQCLSLQQNNGNQEVAASDLSSIISNINDRKSIIIGLASIRVHKSRSSAKYKNKSVLAAVRQLVRSWNDPMLTPNYMIESVDCNGKLFGRSPINGTANVLVTAPTVEANRQLLAAADKYFNNTGDGSSSSSSNVGIKWLPYQCCHRLLSKQSGPQQEVSNLDQSTTPTAAAPGLANIGDNKSSVLAAVRQLVQSWNDPTLTNASELIRSVDQNKRYGLSLTNGTANMLVTTGTIEANLQLLAAADKYINSSSSTSIGIKWEPYLSYRRSKSSQLVQSVIRGLDVKGVRNLTNFVRKLVDNLNIRKIKGSTIKSVTYLSSNGTLFVTTVCSPKTTRALLMTAIQNGIDWTEYRDPKNLNQQQIRDVQEVIENNKNISMIFGLDIPGVDNHLTAYVRRLVDNWPKANRKVNGAMIMSVESNQPIADNLLTTSLFVRACSLEATYALIETAKQNGINWYKYRDTDLVREVVTSSGCISEIHGLNTSGHRSADVLATVRQLVDVWNDPTVTGDLIESVESNTILTTITTTGYTDNNSQPFFYVMAKDTDANSLLLKTAAEKYNSSTGSTSSSSCISWLPHSYRSHYDPVSGQSYTLCIKLLAENYTNIDYDSIGNLIDFVWQLVANWTDKIINRAIIVSVEPYIEKLPVLEYLLLYVRTVSPTATSDLVMALRSRHIKCHIVKHNNLENLTD